MTGATLLNRYRIEAELCRGGMGVVYRAQLSEGAFAAAWAEGQAMMMEPAIAYAMEQNNP